MGRLTKHADIGTGTKHLRVIGTEDDTADFGMFKPQTLDRVIQLDIDTEIVGVQFQLIAGLQRRVFGDCHRQTRDITVYRQIPVLVLIRAGGEIDPRFSTGSGEAPESTAASCGAILNIPSLHTLWLE